MIRYTTSICDTAMNFIVTIDKIKILKYEQLKYYAIILNKLFKNNKLIM